MTQKIFDNFETVKYIANLIGIEKTINLLYENVYNKRDSLLSGDVKNVYDLNYVKLIDNHYTVKTKNNFKINRYSLFIFSYLENCSDKNKDILDFGCGGGELDLALASIGYNVCGIDFNSSEIELANKKREEVKFKNKVSFECENFLNLSSVKKYDYILFSDVVEHLSKQEVDRIFAKSFKLLKENGKILIHTPNGNVDPYNKAMSLYFLISKCYNFFKSVNRKIKKVKLSEKDLLYAYYLQTHINIMKPREISKLLKNNGFNKLKFSFRQDGKIPFSVFLSKMGISANMGVIAVKNRKSFSSKNYTKDMNKGLIDRNIAGNDNIANIYDIKHNNIYNDIEQKRLQLVIKDLLNIINQEKITVLDYGSGTGNLSTKFLKFNCNVTACDISKKSLDFLEKKVNYNTNLKIKLFDGEKLSFNDNSFDVVATYSVLHHIPDYLSAVSEMIRVCKPNGYIYIDHELNENRWVPNNNLKKWIKLTRKNKFEHLTGLFKTGELFSFDFLKTVFVKLFINRRYERQGDLHVWIDDHIEWQKFFDLVKSKNCRIEKNVDYLLYQPKGGIELYNKYNNICSDTKYVFIKKLSE